MLSQPFISIKKQHIYFVDKEFSAQMITGIRQMPQQQ